MAIKKKESKIIFAYRLCPVIKKMSYNQLNWLIDLCQKRLNKLDKLNEKK